MDLKEKIAARRAELQREEEAEEDKKARERAALDREKAKLREEEENVVKELSEKVVRQKILEINTWLQEPSEGNDGVDTSQINDAETTSAVSEEMQIRVDNEVQKKIEAHINSLASRRFTFVEKWTFRLWLFSSLFGFYGAWWIGLGLLVIAFWYRNGVEERHRAKIKSELVRASYTQK